MIRKKNDLLAVPHLQGAVQQLGNYKPKYCIPYWLEDNQLAIYRVRPRIWTWHYPVSNWSGWEPGSKVCHPNLSAMLPPSYSTQEWSLPTTCICISVVHQKTHHAVCSIWVGFVSNTLFLSDWKWEQRGPTDEADIFLHVWNLWWVQDCCGGCYQVHCSYSTISCCTFSSDLECSTYLIIHMHLPFPL